MSYEQDTKSLTKQMLEAVAYCHSCGVVHRDLKPENFVFESHDIGAKLKLIDFGVSTIIQTETSLHMKRCVGTTFYIAPEVISAGKYTSKCDIWSIGVILFILLSGGHFPFNSDTNAELYFKILYDEISFPFEEWADISPEAKDLVKNLLQKDEEYRPEAVKALNQPWLSGSSMPFLGLGDCKIDCPVS